MKSMYYIADMYGSEGKQGYLGHVVVRSDGKKQNVCVHYYKCENKNCNRGIIYISENRLHHIASESETKVCIFRNQRIINPKYKNDKGMRCCTKKIKSNDYVLLMSKDETDVLYKKYLAKLFNLNNRRRYLKKTYLSFGEIFEKICKGNIFILIHCMKS